MLHADVPSMLIRVRGWVRVRVRVRVMNIHIYIISILGTSTWSLYRKEICIFQRRHLGCVCKGWAQSAYFCEMLPVPRAIKSCAKIISPNKSHYKIWVSSNPIFLIDRLRIVLYDSRSLIFVTMQLSWGRLIFSHNPPRHFSKMTVRNVALWYGPRKRSRKKDLENRFRIFRR